MLTSRPLLKKRFSHIDATTSEKKRKQRRAKEHRKKKKKSKQKRALKQATKILHSCDIDKTVIDLIMAGEKTVLKLKDFNLVSLKLSPKLHLQGITYLIESKCLDVDAEKQFRTFEDILTTRRDMQTKAASSHQDIEEIHDNLGVQTDDGRSDNDDDYSTGQESDEEDVVFN
ncbi:hypothetical protein AC249_AIPGENE12407 [Exaiptasia diaphana]|nr:hypothetical protein AC249_AIPGENE12407 [Exaiptasia diaphana]